MNPPFWKMIIPFLIAGIITACAPTDVDQAGIGGSGYISSGSVTGFGSVKVNGVKFETDSTHYDFEDSIGSQDDLRIGMVVQVKGSVNPDGVTGIATDIRYGDQLQGPVSGTLEINADATTKSFRVMGSNIIVDAIDTVYEGMSFESLQLNNVLEISGFYDQNNVLHATYVELKGDVFNPSETVELEGSISTLTGSMISIRNVDVNTESANLSGFNNGLEMGVYVEVKGTYNPVNNTITASEIEAENIEFKDDGSEISVEGYITRYVSVSDFDINGYKVNATSAEFEPVGLQLAAGLKVEAKGTVSNGILNAKAVKNSSGDVLISAHVDTVDDAAGTFTVRVVPGQPAITVSINNSTTLEDDLPGIEPFSLKTLNNNEFVEILGYESGVSVNSIVATKVKRRLPDDIILRGMATTVVGGTSTSGTVTVLGVSFTFDEINTIFNDKNDLTLNSTVDIEALVSTMSSASTLVKIKYSSVSVDGIADEVHQED